MPLMLHDDVVNDFDAEDAARFYKSPRHANVRIGRRWVAARMIVHEHDAVRRADDRSAKHSWMRHRLIQGPMFIVLRLTASIQL